MALGDAHDNSDVDLLLLGRWVDVVTEQGLHPAMRDQVLAQAVTL